MNWLSVCRLGCKLDEEIIEFLVEVVLSLPQTISVTIQSPLQWVSQFFPNTSTGQFLKLITDLYLGLKSGIYGALPPHTFVFVVWCLVTRRDSITLWLPLHITSQSIQQINFLPATKQNVQFQAIIEHFFMLFYRVNVQQKITLIFGRGCFTHLKCIRKQNLQCLPVDVIACVSSCLKYQQTQH